MNGYAYDPAGNLLSTGFGVMQWDAENRIASASGATYLYDADGNRVEVQSSGITDTYTFGGKPIARLKNPQVTNGVLSGGEWTDLIYGPNGLLAEVPGNQTAVPTYRVTDHLGTTAASLDQLGNLINPIDTAPFGRTLAGQTADPYIFTGKERDAESGLDYFGARYYASSMGRFVSPDWSAGPDTVPYANFRDPQTLNLYSYVRNMPLQARDADGHALNHEFDNIGCNSANADLCTGAGYDAAMRQNDQQAQQKAQQQTQYGKQADGSYKADPAAVKKAIAGGKAIGSGECVALCRFLSGAPNSGTWTAGQHAAGLTDADIGTAIATFDSSGHYPSDNDPLGKNSAIFMGRGAQGSIWVVDQWPVGDGPPGTHQPFLHEIRNYAPDNSTHPLRSNNADAYYVIRVP